MYTLMLCKLPGTWAFVWGIDDCTAFDNEAGMNTGHSEPSKRTLALKFLMGVMFALALILIEFGIADIALSRDDICREQAALSKLGIVPADYCMSDGVRYFMVVLSYGFSAPMYITRSKLVARLSTALIYAVFGGGMALLPRRKAMTLFGIVHVVLLLLLFFFTFISDFLVF